MTSDQPKDTTQPQLDIEPHAAQLAEAEDSVLDNPVMRALERIAKQVGGHADARAVFGDPVSSQGITVIPVARVMGGFGAGGSQEGAGAANIGGGGGFGAQPVGFIEIDRNGARYRRIDDATDTRLGMATLAFDLARRGYEAWKRRKK